jgi:glyoxylase I family protein
MRALPMSRIEHFALFAADPRALADFYIDAFGLRVILDNSAADPPGYFLADDAGSALEIIGRPSGEPAVGQRYVCHVAFRVEDVAATRAEFERRGLRFEGATAVDTADVKTAFFADPEGNRGQIVWRRRALGSY